MNIPLQMGQPQHLVAGSYRVTITPSWGLPNYDVFHAVGFEPARIYRRFKVRSHAEALLQGDVFISTLEACRGYETVGQGDKKEGEGTWSIRKADSPAGLAAQRMMSRKGGPTFEDCEFVNCAADIRIISRIPDAYVICSSVTADQPADVFGEYCVEICNPRLFFWLVTNRLVIRKPIIEAAFTPVIHAALDRWDEERQPGPVGAVKRLEFSSQCEARLIWNTGENPIKPFILSVPRVPRLCRFLP